MFYRVSQNQPDSTFILTSTDLPVLARSDRSGHDRARVTPSADLLTTKLLSKLLTTGKRKSRTVFLHGCCG